VAGDLGRTRHGSSARAKTEQRLRKRGRESNSHFRRNMYGEREKTKINTGKIKEKKNMFLFLYRPVP
jgi:hypothetical protein